MGGGESLALWEVPGNDVVLIAAGMVKGLCSLHRLSPKATPTSRSNKGYMSIGAEDVEAQVPGSAAAAAARAAAEDAFESKVEKVRSAR